MAGTKLNPEQGQKEEILAFVRAHPGCTTHDIQAGCSIKILSRIGMYLADSVKLPKDRLLRWHAIDLEEKPIDDEPVRIVRKEWTAHEFTDPLTAALFGQYKRSDDEKTA